MQRLRGNPHRLIEGCFVAGQDMNPMAAYTSASGEIYREVLLTQQATDEMYKVGFLGGNVYGSWYKPVHNLIDGRGNISVGMRQHSLSASKVNTGSYVSSLRS
jgi:NADH:ubiquinone oxidoreductase subunit F (NADH-binding)